MKVVAGFGAPGVRRARKGVLRTALFASTALVGVAMTSPVVAQVTIARPAQGGTITVASGVSATTYDATTTTATSGGLTIELFYVAAPTSFNAITINNSTGSPSVDALHFSATNINSVPLQFVGASNLATTQSGGAAFYITVPANSSTGFTAGGSIFTGSYGIYGVAPAGDIDVNSTGLNQSFVANGTAVAGIYLRGSAASAELGGSTISGFATGVDVSGPAGVSVTSTGGSIAAGATGISAVATAAGTATVSSGSAITVGNGGTGISATTSGGAISVTTVAGGTIGGGAYGITTSGGSATVSLASAVSGSTNSLLLGTGTNSVTLNSGTTLGGTADLGSGTNTLTLAGAGTGDTLAVDAVLNATNLVKTGTGTWTLTGTAGSGDFTGGTTISAGRIIENNTAKALGTGPIAIGAGATLELANTNVVNDPTNNVAPTTFTGTGTIVKSGAGLTAFGNAGNVNVALSQGGLIDVEGGNLHGSANNQAIWTDNKAGLYVAAGATFDGVEGAIFVDALTGSGSVVGGFAGVRVTTIGVAGGSGTFSGTIGDSGAGRILALTKTGTGVQTLTGTNTYSGATTISGGTLALSGTGSIANSASIADNATFDISGLTNGGISVANLTGTGAVNLGGNTLTLATPGTVALNISDGGITGGTGGNVTLSGAGTYIFTGLSSYTGATTINSGTTLTATNNQALGAGAVVDNGALAFNGASGTTTNGAISGSGTLSVSNVGAGNTLTFAAALGNVQGLTIGDASSVTLQSGATGGIVESGAGDRTLTIAGGSATNATANAQGRGVIVNTSSGTTTINVASGAAIAQSAALEGAGIYAFASSLVVNNSGTISTAGLSTVDGITALGGLRLVNTGVRDGSGVLTGGIITAANASGIAFSGTGSSITNSGSITGGNDSTYGYGVQAGGTTAGLITNQSGGTLTGGLAGIGRVGTGAITIDNSGVVSGTAANSSGITITGGTGTITNEIGGVIAGIANGILSNVTTTIINAGTIGTGTVSGTTYAANNTGSYAIETGGGGTVTNLAGGSIVSGSTAIYSASGPPLIVDNAGAISGGNGANSIYQTGSGGLTLVNRAGGSIEGSTAVYVDSGIALTVVNAGSITADGGVGVGSDGGSGLFRISNANGATIQGGSDSRYGQGIQLNSGAGSIVDNYGTIKSGSANTYAINSTDNSYAVNLYAGSTTGAIQLGGGDDAVALYTGVVGAAAVTTADPILGGTATVTLRAAGDYSAATFGTIGLGGGANTLTLRGVGTDATTGGSVGQQGSLNLAEVTGLTTLTKLDAGTWTITGDALDTGLGQINAGTGSTSGAAGLLIFDSTSNLTSAITVNGATIRATTAGAFGSGTITTIDPTVQYGATGIYTNNIILASTNTASEPTTLQADNGVNATLSGTISEASAGQPLVINTAGSTGTITLTGANSYTGLTTVAGGTLAVDGSNVSGATVSSGATLTGTGSLGATTIADGGILAGVQGNTLTMSSLSLSSGSIIDATFTAAGGNALFAVGGNLTLAGTVNVASIGAFGLGVYRLASYGGTLTDNGLAVGTAPVDAQQVSVQTSVAGQVNLVSSPSLVQFWDGGNAALYNNGSIDGGSGTWTATSPTFADANGRFNGPMSPRPGFAVFEATPGTVTVDDSAGAIAVTGMQFASNGYVVTGGSIGLTSPTTVIRVGDGTTAGAGYVATIASALTGTGGLNKTDLGTLILTGANSYTGVTTITAGTLRGTTSSIVGSSIVDNGVLDYHQAVAGTAGQAISGTGVVQIDGGGSVALTGAVTAQGGVVIGTGTTATLSNVSTSGATAVSLAGDNATLNVAQGGSIAATNGGAVNVTGQAGTINNGGSITSTSSYVGVYFNPNTGTGTLANTGSISGGNAVFSGSSLSLVNSGTLTGTTGPAVVATGALGLSNAGTIMAASTYAIDAAASSTIANLAGGTISGAAGIFTGGATTIDNDGMIASHGSGDGIDVVGGGTVTNHSDGTIDASGNPQAWGVAVFNAPATVVNAGTITAGSGLVSGIAGTSFTNTGTITAQTYGVWGSGAPLTLTNSGTISGGTTGVLAEAAGSTIINSGSIAAGAAGGTGVAMAGGTLTNQSGGTISGNGTGAALTLTGTGNIVNLDAGSTTNGLVDGSLATGSNAYVIAGALNGGLTAGTGGDTVTLLTGAAVSGTIDGGTGTSSFLLDGADTGTLNAGQVVDFQSRTKNGSGTFTLTGTDTSTAPWTINAGTLSVSGGNAIADGTAVTITANGTLDLASSETIGSLSGVGNVTLNTSTLTTGFDNTDSGFAGTISGSGGLTKIGTGIFTLSGTAGYTGATIVEGGTLQLGASGVLSDASGVNVASGATLDLQGNSATVASLSLAGTLAGTGTLTAATYALNGATVGANLGAGIFDNVGGTSTLYGTAGVATVNVDAGTLLLGASQRFSDSAALNLAAGSTFDLAGYTQTVALLNGGGTVALGAGTLTDAGASASDFSGTISGTGTFAKTGSGALTLTGNESLTGLIELDGGTTTFTGSTAGGIRINGGTLVSNATVAGNLALASGTLSPGTTLGAIGTLRVGTLTVSGGTLAIDAAGSAGNFASDTIKVSGAATLTGGTVTVAATEPFANYKTAQDYVLVQAGSVSGTFASANSSFTQTSNDSGLYYRLRYDVVPDGVLLEIRKAVDFTQALGGSGTANQYAVANALHGGDLVGSDAYVTAVGRIATLAPAQQAAAFDALSGQSIANITTAAIEASGRFIDMLRDRISLGGSSSDNPGGLLAGLFGRSNVFQQARVGSTTQTPSMGLADGQGRDDGAPHAGLWVQGFGAAGTIDGQSGTSKMVDDSTGIAVGLDAQFGALRIGGAFAKDHLDTKLRALSSTSKGNLHRGAVYLAYDNGHAYANAIGSYFDGSQASARNVIVGGTSIGTASAKPDLNGWSGAGTAGYRIVLDNGVKLTPQVEGGFTRVKRNAFSEGGIGVFSLDVAQDKRTIYTAGGDLRVSKPFALGGGTVEPYVSGGIVFNLGDRDATSAMQFEGAPTGSGAFIVDGVRLPREAARVTGGLQVQATQRVSFGVGAEALLADRQHEGAVNMHIQVGF